MKVGSILFAAVVSLAGAQNWSVQTSGTTQELDGVWFADVQNGVAVGAAGAALRTNDGGVTWLPFPLTGQDLHDVAFKDRSTGLIVGDNGLIFRTTNSGMN